MASSKACGPCSPKAAQRRKVLLEEPSSINSAQWMKKLKQGSQLSSLRRRHLHTFAGTLTRQTWTIRSRSLPFSAVLSEPAGQG